MRDFILSVLLFLYGRRNVIQWHRKMRLNAEISLEGEAGKKKGIRGRGKRKMGEIEQNKSSRDEHSKL
jgi:hypothetical protein